MYALACCGHLGQAGLARATLARLRQQGRSPDWLLGVSREPYRDPAIRDRLKAGLKLALAYG